MNHEHFQNQVKSIYKAVKELEKMFPNRPFTPDGHMVGSLGECLVADAYNLTLKPPSNEGFDAVTEDGLKVEIKATQANRVSFRSCPEHAIIIKIYKDGTFKECYNGPGNIIWSEISNRPLPSNGQYPITINNVISLNELVPDSERIPAAYSNALHRID